MKEPLKEGTRVKVNMPGFENNEARIYEYVDSTGAYLVEVMLPTKLYLRDSEFSLIRDNERNGEEDIYCLGCKRFGECACVTLPQPQGESEHDDTSCQNMGMHGKSVDGIRCACKCHKRVDMECAEFGHKGHEAKDGCLCSCHSPKKDHDVDGCEIDGEFCLGCVCRCHRDAKEEIIEELERLGRNYATDDVDEIIKMVKALPIKTHA